MREIARMLSQVPLLHELEEADLERLADATRPITFAAEEDVVRIGAAGHALYLILEGSVQVLYPARTAEFELARLGPGDFFGEMALLNDKPRSATVRAVETVRALALEKEEFRAAVRESPALALRLLEALSVRIRNADEQISTLSDQALRDPLTGLLNRRALQERVVQEVDRARRYGTDFSLVLIDLDRFKSINDNLGHDVGDLVLGWVGRILLEHTRTADSPFRVGGEEFAVLCPSTGPDTARAVAHRLVEVVAEARPPIESELHVTMSAGFASCPTHGDTLEAVYRVADQALLQAKREGRNRVGEPAALRASD